uniref:Uncharacterized protein n=1 Tax=Hyaloperonospora arabidopsidis (strain Emoy2) TaxID=559515 RepID=M4BNY2_HYAAE
MCRNLSSLWSLSCTATGDTNGPGWILARPAIVKTRLEVRCCFVFDAYVVHGTYLQQGPVNGIRRDEETSGRFAKKRKLKVPPVGGWW